MTTREEAEHQLRALSDGAIHLKTQCGPDARMVWRKWGQGRPLVLLHGGAGTWMHWAHNVEALARERTVYAADMPGFGDSDVPAGVTDASTVAPHVLNGILELIGDQPFDLAGFSFGSLVSAMVASKAPPSLERLVMCSVAGMGITARPALQSMRGITDPEGRKAVFRNNLNALMLYDADAIDEMAILIQETGVTHERLRNREEVRHNILPGILQQCQCRKFGIWGTMDALYRDNLPRLQASVAALPLDGHRFLEGAGHWLPYERPADYKTILDGYLNA